MRKIPILLGVVLACMPGITSAGLSRQVVNYDIHAKLLPETKTLEGRETLVWLNDSNTEVTELPFHLYLNAFKNNRTTFMKESGGLSRGFKADDANWGRITVRSIRLQNGPDLTPTLAYAAPDDGNPDDQTVMRVTLPAPVKPGETAALEIAFETKLPKVFARSGFVGNFFMVGQWFPKIGVLRDGVWNCHQYHAQSEFFADYGVFTVEITVPESYVVGATGRRVKESRNADGTKSLVYFQEDVHDFAWTACPDFVESRERFTLDEPMVDTEMIFLVHRAHLGQRDRYVRALKQGLEFYSKNYGAYPYGTITLVDPAPGGMGAGGMEYPTLFTAGTTSFIPRGLRMPEMVTIHEFGHGYWYGIVGSNEFEEAWLDEGINTYSEIKAMDLYYGSDRSMIDFPGLKIGDFSYQRLATIGSGRFDPIVRNSWDYISGSSYSLNVYSKAGIMMLTLEKVLGKDAMAKVMKTYFETWKFRHPRTEDFVRTAEETSGRDLGWFFGQVLHSPDKLDYAITDLRSEEVQEPKGIFDGKAGAAGKFKTGTAAGADEKTARKPAFRNTVVVARLGEWIFPQEIKVTFADGKEVRETWDGRDRWKKFVTTLPVKLAFAQVDPENRYLLDVNFANNSRTLAPTPWAAWKYALGFMGWVQHLLSFVSL